MRKRQEWWLAVVLLVSAVVVGGMLVTGCEYFKPTPQEPPPPPPDNGGQEDDDGGQQQSQYPDVTGAWDVDCRTGGVKVLAFRLILTQDEGDVEGSWHLTSGGPPIGGDVEGDLDKDGDIDIDLKVGGTTAFALQDGEVEDDGDEMEGDDWKYGTTQAANGSWDAEKD